MKLGWLIEYDNKNIFLRKLCRNGGRKTSSRPLFIFKKCLIWGKSKWSAAYFQYISIALNLVYSKNKLYRTLGYWYGDIINFDFPEKCLGLVSPPNFVYDFSRIMFLMSFSINWQNLSDYFYFLRYWAICVLQLFVNQFATS